MDQGTPIRIGKYRLYEEETDNVVSIGTDDQGVLEYRAKFATRLIQLARMQNCGKQDYCCFDAAEFLIGNTEVLEQSYTPGPNRDFGPCIKHTFNEAITGLELPIVANSRDHVAVILAATSEEDAIIAHKLGECQFELARFIDFLRLPFVETPTFHGKEKVGPHARLSRSNIIKV